MNTERKPVDVLAAKLGPIARARKDAIRRRALKRWLRSHGVSYKARNMYSESALRKLVRDAIARVSGGAK